METIRGNTVSRDVIFSASVSGEAIDRGVVLGGAGDVMAPSYFGKIT